MSRFDLDNDKRVFGLDVFRALAILIVILGHANQFLMPWASTPIFKSVTIGTVISIPFTFVDGVDLFFALSGFLIGGILLKQFRKEPVFGRKELVNFWMRRWLRTLPAYLIILLVNIGLLFTILPDATVEKAQLPKYFFFVQNLTHDGMVFFQESWSLSVEEWFYLTFPFFLACFGLVVRGKSRTWVFVAACAVYILVVVLGRGVYGLQHLAANPAASWGGELRRITLLRLDAILWGVIFAAFQAYYGEAFHKYRYHFAVVGLGLVLGSPIPGYAIHGAHQQPYMFVGYFTLLSAGYACFLPLAFSIKKTKVPAFKFLTFVSVVSYSLYLVNYSIILHLIKAAVAIDTPAKAAAAYVGFLAVSLLAAAGLYLAVEKPVLAYRDRVVKEH